MLNYGTYKTRKINFITIKPKLFMLLFGFILTVNVFAQNKVIYEINGTLIEKNSRKPIEYATVSVYKTKDSSLVTGAISNDKGYFMIDKLPHGKYYLSVSALGYKNKQMHNINFSDNKKINLGSIYLKIDVKALDEVVINGERKLIELKPDKKIVHIEKSIAASGGSAVDALQIVPQIEVEGKHITLKNQSFKILLNGKPSGMTSVQLFDIPASNIQRIEVITNPSVKYNPEGLGGIINVITKKKGYGFNGLIQASGGTDNSYNTAGTMNFRKGKYNFFATSNGNYYGGHSEGYLDKTIYNYSILHENFTDKQNFYRYNWKAGFDYDIDSLNLLTLFWSQSDDNGKYNKQIDFYDISNNQTLRNNNKIKDKVISQQNNFTFSYKHIFNRKETYLTLDAVQSFYFNEPQHQQFTDYIIPNSEKRGFRHTPFEKNKMSDIKLNFNYWLNSKMQIEAGLNAILSNEINNNSSATYNVTNNEWIDSLSIKNKFTYNENIFGNYFLFSYAHKKLNFNFGIRNEYTLTKSFFENTNNDYTNNYFDFYPSAGITYSANKELDLSLSYSRRIERPYAFQLNPFVYSGDFVSEQIIGNTNIKPAYSNSFEIDISQNWDKVSINADISYINGTDIIDKIFYLSQDSISTKTWGNVSNNNTYSLYASIYWKTAKWCKMYLSGSFDKSYSLYNYNNIKRKRDYLNYNFKYTVRFYLKKNWSAYINAKYYAPINYYASKVEGGFRFYLGISKNITEKFTLSFRLNDITNKKYIYYSWSDDFTSKSYTNYNKRSVYIGFMYKFGGKVKTRSKTYLNTRLKMER